MAQGWYPAFVYESPATLEVSEMRTTFRQAQSVTFLLAVQTAGPSLRKDATGRCSLSRFCEVGEALWSGAHHTGKDTYRLFKLE